jgi:hypothetical protein
VVTTSNLVAETRNANVTYRMTWTRLEIYRMTATPPRKEGNKSDVPLRVDIPPLLLDYSAPSHPSTPVPIPISDHVQPCYLTTMNDQPEMPASATSVRSHLHPIQQCRRCLTLWPWAYFPPDGRTEPVSVMQDGRKELSVRSASGSSSTNNASRSSMSCARPARDQRRRSSGGQTYIAQW